MKNVKKNYYTEVLPTDLIDGLSDDHVFDIAVMQIRERQRKYHLPAQWNLVRLDRDTGAVRVRYDHR